jgi:hypothetical protein
LVDHLHIDQCDLIKIKDFKNSKIVEPLAQVDSLWEIESGKLEVVKESLAWLNGRLERLNGSIYVLVNAKRAKEEAAKKLSIPSD